MTPMKNRPLLALSVVLATVAITATLTRGLVGAQALARREAVVPGGSTTLISRQQGAIPRQAMPTSPALVRSARMTGMEVKADGNLVAVSGGADIYDTVPGSNYVWLLRVYTDEPQKRLVTEHHYFPQATAIPEGNASLSPTFSDAFALLPGKYRVELSIYAVPPGFQPGQVGFGEDMAKIALAKVSHIKKVVVGG